MKFLSFVLIIYQNFPKFRVEKIILWNSETYAFGQQENFRKLGKPWKTHASMLPGSHRCRVRTGQGRLRVEKGEDGEVLRLHSSECDDIDGSFKLKLCEVQKVWWICMTWWNGCSIQKNCPCSGQHCSMSTSTRESAWSGFAFWQIISRGLLSWPFPTNGRIRFCWLFEVIMIHHIVTSYFWESNQSIWDIEETGMNPVLVLKNIRNLVWETQQSSAGKPSEPHLASTDTIELALMSKLHWTFQLIPNSHSELSLDIMFGNDLIFQASSNHTVGVVCPQNPRCIVIFLWNNSSSHREKRSAISNFQIGIFFFEAFALPPKKKVPNFTASILRIEYLGGGFKYFIFHPYMGKWSNLTSIFFRCVGSTTN